MQCTHDCIRFVKMSTYVFSYCIVIYINVLQQIYKGNKGFISLDRDSKTFPISKGTKQGCPLSPDLFNSVLELIFQNIYQNKDWSEYGLTINGTKLNHLRFADDIVLFGKNADELTHMLSDLEEESQKHGLFMNKDKTKALPKNYNDRIFVNGTEINNVTEYIYLGQTVSFQDKSNKEISRRISQGWKKYWSLKNILKSKATKNIKSKVMISCVSPTLLYGSQTWAPTVSQHRRLQSTHQSMKRSILGLKIADKVRNTQINKMLNLHNISIEARRLKWKWAGHVARMNNSRWAKKITEWTPLNKKRSFGRPRIRWRDELVKGAGVNWSTKAKDRDLRLSKSKNVLHCSNTSNENNIVAHTVEFDCGRVLNMSQNLIPNSA